MAATAGCAVVALTAPVTAPPVDRAAIVQDEAYWVSTAQLTCAGDGTGAIAEARIRGPGPVSVHPYEANIGARALVAAGPRYGPMVQNYLRWYLGHLNHPDTSGVDGTVYDYDYDPATCAGDVQTDPLTGTAPSFDSSDAYAGTFLSLVAAYARADPGAAVFLAAPAVREGLDSVAGAILATLRPSGLTAATPTYDAEYLLDNVESQQGLDAYAWLLASVFGDADGGRNRAAQAAGIRAAIETRLWRAGGYAVAADDGPPSWERWYPDSIAQLWPVWDLLGPPARRESAWATFQAHWPDWTDSTPSYGVVSADHDPNAAVAYAAARVGDTAAVDAYLTASQRTWAAAGRPAPWTVDDSGFRALAAQVG